MHIPMEPDIRSRSAWLHRLPQLSLCPRTPGSTWEGQGDGVTPGGLSTACVCVSHSPFSRLVALSSPPSRDGSLPKLRALELICPCPSTRSISSSRSRQEAGALLPVCGGSVWAWALAALGQSPACGAGGSLERCHSRTAAPGLVAILPASLVMSLSLTIITAVVLLLRRYSRKSSRRSISGCAPAFVTHSSCRLVTRLHFSSRLSMSVLWCHVFCPLLEEEPDLQLRSGPGQPTAPCPSAQQSQGTRTTLEKPPVLCPGGGFFPSSQCFTLSPNQEDLYF